MADIRTTLKGLRTAQASQLTRLQLKQEADSELLDSMSTYFRKRSEIELQYTASLDKLNRFYQQKRFKRSIARGLAEKPLSLVDEAPATETSTYAAFAVMLAEADREVQKHVEIATKLQTDIHDVAKEFGKHKNAGAKRFLEYAAKYQGELANAYDELDKARSAYDKMAKETEASRKKYDDASNKKKGGLSALRNLVGDSEERAEKFRSKWKNNARKLNEMRNDYILALVNVNTIQNSWYKQDLPKLMRDLDGDFYVLFSDLLKNHANYEQSSLPVIQHSVEETQRWAAQINRDKENTSFLTDFSAIFETPLNFDFVPGTSDEITSITVDDVTSIALGNKLGLIQARKDFVGLEISQKEKELSGLNQMAQVYSIQPEFGDAQSSLDVRQDLETSLGLLRAEFGRLSVLAKTLTDLNVVSVKPTLDENGNLQASLSGFNPIGKSKQVVQLADGSKSNGAASSGQSMMVNAGSNATVAGAGKQQSLALGSNNHLQASTIGGVGSGSLSNLAANQVKALYDFKGGEEDELPFTAGDIIDVTETGGDLTSDAWWEGVNVRTGKKGSFPVVFVQGWQNVSATAGGGGGGRGGKRGSPVSSMQPASAGVLSPGSGGRKEFPVRVLFEYEATCDGELSLVAGEIVRVINTETGADAWWEGEGVNGRGQFPKDYTEEVSEEEATQARSATIGAAKTITGASGSGRMVRALYDYTAAAEDEITFKAGERIEVLDESDSDWWTGRVGGKTGAFPSAYVEPV